MKIIIQIILIGAALSIVLVVLSNRTSHSGRAWKKIGLLLLGLLMVVAVIFPDSTNHLASLFGIGRGADLLLYGLVVAFILYTLNNYLHYQDQRDAIYRLARKVALLEASKKE